MNGPSKHNRGMGFTVFALAIIGVFACWFWQVGQQSRALAAMSADERSAFYQRTLTNLDSICLNDKKHDLIDFCREQAKLVIQFPECAPSCANLAKKFLPQASR